MDPTNAALLTATVMAAATGTCSYLEDLQVLE